MTEWHMIIQMRDNLNSASIMLCSSYERKKVDLSKKDSESASMPSNLSLASQVVKYRSCKLLSQKNRLVLNLDFNIFDHDNVYF